MTRDYQELAPVPPFVAHPKVKTKREQLDEETGERIGRNPKGE